jgi:hypothetical protein
VRETVLLVGSGGYKIANDYRMARMLRGLYTNPKLVWRIARSVARHPRAGATMLECFFIEKTWDWQFRGEDPPMRLLRHTWRRNPLVEAVACSGTTSKGDAGTFPGEALSRHTGKSVERSTKHEIRNKSEIRSTNVQNAGVSERRNCLEHSHFGL